MSYRIDRLNSEMLKVIADVIDNKIKDPRVTEMVSVSRVEVAKDLKTAKVYLSLYGNKDKIDATFDGIVRAGGFIRKELSLAFRDIRQVPELRFIKDDSLDYSAKIESVIEEIKKNDAD